MLCFFSRSDSFASQSPVATSSVAVVSKKRTLGVCRALYDYDAQSDLELSFKEGDLITILEKDDSGWWHGELNGLVRKSDGFDCPSDEN